MSRRLLAVVLAVAVAAPAAAQTRRPSTRKPAPKPPATKTEPAALECPSVLGMGVATTVSYCDVLTGVDPAGGIVVRLPPHTGPVTLSFDLHNRHTYSEELIKTNRAYRRYTATIGIMAMDVTLLSRFVIRSEFRTPADLVDRIGGGAGPGGVKAVAPTGTEHFELVIDPKDAPEDAVSILGEKLNVVRPDAAFEEFKAPGRPIAIVSNVQVTYRPGPARKPPARR
jgi:hypothetical protein